jgi:hypothetical protein
MVKSKDGNEFRLPQKIDHFRIVKNERDENDDYILDDQIIEVIKDNPAAVYDKEMNIIGIPIRLLYNEIDLVFPTQYVSYVNGKLSCSGNGIKGATRDGREVACPCKRLDGAYTGKDKCKISGTLSCIIEGCNVGGCYKFRTTSINSARYILSSLMLIKAATGGLLSFIPLRLVINPKKTIIPATGAPTTIYVVTVEFQGGIDQLQKKALEMGRERVNLIENMRDIEIEARKIVSSDIDTDREEKEFAEEFFPENIETTEVISGKDSVKKADKAKTTGGETVKATDKTESAKKEDPLLGQARKPKAVNKITGLPTESTVSKTTVKPAVDSEEKKPVEQETSTVPETTPFEIPERIKTVIKIAAKEVKKPELTEEQISEATGIPIKIRKDQLFKILDLKVNKRQINDQKVWHKLIKNMKFPDVTKANDMTVEQGDKFIKFLEELGDVPF